MKETNETSSKQIVESGVGTQGNREAQKVDAGKQGADTTAPGVPQPQSGGPEPRGGSPSQGASDKS